MDEMIIENLECVGGAMDGQRVSASSACNCLERITFPDGIGCVERYRRVIRPGGTVVFLAESLCQTEA